LPVNFPILGFEIKTTHFISATSQPRCWRVMAMKRNQGICASTNAGGDTLIPGSFDYVAARSVPEAIALLQQYGDEAKILAGGHSLIPILRYRLASPSILIDINRIDDLEYMQETDGTLHIGTLTREATLDSSPLIRKRYPILHDTAVGVADPVVRNWATVGGNIAHADPANDHPATMLALGASFVVEGPDGRRIIPVTEFFTDAPFETTLRPNEVLTEIRIPVPTARSGGAYCKLERKVGDYAIAGVATCISLDADGLVAQAGIGLTNVGPYPIKARDAEQALLGKPLDEVSMQQAAELAAAASQPASDTRGPAEYKRAMVHTLCVRALRKSLARATGVSVRAN
jgi:carbon-monoxide dehydrogenase medium subunit